jgi:hypothetical protein
MKIKKAANVPHLLIPPKTSFVGADPSKVQLILKDKLNQEWST